MPERTEKAQKKRSPRGGDLDASSPTTAAHQLERILYILPAAAQEGGAALDELASRLGVTPDTVSTDLTDVTARAYYHPADSGSELLEEMEAADLRPGPGGIRDTVTGALQEKTALRIRYLQDRPLDRRAGRGGVG